MVTLRATRYSKKNRTTDMLPLNNFHLDCHSLGFHPQTQNLELRCTA